MVCLEIMLGDEAPSDEAPLGATLRNRCAYLIAKNSAERARILKDFKEIYEVRSRIVHRGKFRLNREERFLLRRLNELCERVLRKELDMLLSDEGS